LFDNTSFLYFLPTCIAADKQAVYPACEIYHMRVFYFWFPFLFYLVPIFILLQHVAAARMKLLLRGAPAT
jgi:hypothetical protein